jgi:hypothetical protein
MADQPEALRLADGFDAWAWDADSHNKAHAPVSSGTLFKAAQVLRSLQAEVEALRAQVAPIDKHDDLPPDGQQWFYCTTHVTSVSGWQRWRVAATSLDEAKEIFKQEGGVFDSEELEVQDFDRPDWD